MSGRERAIARRFGRAAASYDAAAALQRLAASRLAGRIAQAGLPARPRVLEVGCGTGLLSAALDGLLADADWTLTDLSPEMLQRCRARLAGGPGRRFVAMDAQHPALRPGFDLICGNLVAQWFADRTAALRRLAALLAEGGVLALSTLGADSFGCWRDSLAAEGLADRTQPRAGLSALQAEWPAGGTGRWEVEWTLQRHPSGMEFLRGLRAIGADWPREGTRAGDPLALRRAIRRFEATHDAVADYQIAYGVFRRARGAGVFVAGTDTGVGKTLVAACLVRAWGGRYFKPLQTGLADEPGDTETVRDLAGLGAAGLGGARLVPPRFTFQAPLSPEAAAAREGRVIDLAELVLPPADGRPLVVEGAGGLMVPVAAGEMMIDLICRLGLPVVLVARRALGTINHTLLSLQALRARGITVLGVVLNGPGPAGEGVQDGHGNAEAIARHGAVRIIAELPPLARIDREAVAELAGRIPPLASLARDAASQ